MRIGTSIGMRTDPTALRTSARDLESAGVDVFWVGEAYSADAVSKLGFLAAVTERATIGSSILPIYTRTPTLLAMTALGLDLLSEGRFLLGLGASGPQVIEGFHGVPHDHPVGRTRETIEMCRSIWRRERLVHQGDCYQVPLPAGRGTGLGKALKTIEAPLRPNIPVYVAALGGKNVEMTAELAEGWLPLHFWPERAGRLWNDSLAAGSARRDPALGRLEIVAGGPLAIGDGVERLRDRARPALALYFGGMGAPGRNYYNETLKRYGFDREARDIQDAYLGGDRKRAAALVPQELIDGMTLVGDRGFVRDRIAAYREAGVTVLNVEPVGDRPLRDIETLAGWLA